MLSSPISPPTLFPHVPYKEKLSPVWNTGRPQDVIADYHSFVLKSAQGSSDSQGIRSPLRESQPRLLACLLLEFLIWWAWIWEEPEHQISNNSLGQNQLVQGPHFENLSSRANFSWKEPVSKDFLGQRICVAAIQLCCCSRKAARGDM